LLRAPRAEREGAGPIFYHFSAGHFVWGLMCILCALDVPLLFYVGFDVHFVWGLMCILCALEVPLLFYVG
jgi:hypothetical protein